jgi:hypothetical protein
MLMYFARMDSTVFRTRLMRFSAICLSIWALSTNVQADDNVVTTAATKSENDDKPSIDEAHPLYKLLEVAYKARKALENVGDYQCTFTKREMLKSKLLRTTMQLKHRETPFSVYLKFMDLNEGREVIYVEGLNNNNMLVHEAGVKSILGTFNIPPKSSDALAENRYPVTSIGLKNMIDTVIRQWENEGKFGGIKTVKRPNSKWPSGEICTVYEVVHEQYKEFKFHTTRLHIDDKTGIAIGVEQLAFRGKNEKEQQVAEEYFYSQLKTNLKFTDIDFDPKNSKYAFR